MSGNYRSGGPFLPLRQRIQLHNEVLRLRKYGLSYNEIIERIHRSNRVRLNKSNISDWVRGKRQPLGKVIKFYARPSPQLAYVIGVKFSDGDLYCKPKNYQFAFELKVIDYEFAAETGRSLARLLGRKKPYVPKWAKSQFRWRVRCSSALLYRFLQQPFENLKPLVEHCVDCVAAFLRAFYDGEGSISGKSLTVYNASEELLLYVQQLLRRHFGIESTGPRKSAKPGRRFHDPRTGKVYETNKQVYYLYIRVDSLPVFLRRVGFTIRRKQHRLVEAVEE